MIFGSNVIYFRNKRSPDALPDTVQFYQGAIKDFEPHGAGFVIYEDQSHYEGSFQRGLYEGRGVLRQGAGPVYSGEFRAHRPHGRGSEKWENGRSYEGSYWEGKKQGVGRLVYENGEQYEGEFYANQFQGIGAYEWPAERRQYVGQFEASLMQGDGVLIDLAAKTKYLGKFREDVRHGFGVQQSQRDTGSALTLAYWREDAPDGEGLVLRSAQSVFWACWKGGKKVKQQEITQQSAEAPWNVREQQPLRKNEILLDLTALDPQDISGFYLNRLDQTSTIIKQLQRPLMKQNTDTFSEKQIRPVNEFQSLSSMNPDS